MEARKFRNLNSFLTFAMVIALLLPNSAHAGTSIGTGFCASEVGSTSGVTASVNGSYCVLKFVTTSNLTTLSTTWTAPPGVSQLRVLAVGGGGGGGNDAGGGGGGGQVVDTATVKITYGSTYAIVAGGGGDHGDATWGLTASTSNTGGVTGATSSFGTNLVVALGGSGAVGRSDRQAGRPTASGWDNNGFTGGGGGLYVAGSTGVGGSGYAGGSAYGNTNAVGAGGGGAGGAGTSVTTGNNGGNGGTGVNSDITGTLTCYGGGGGGASNSGTAGTGTCGGKAGGTNASVNGGNGDTGFGGGGGGGSGSASLNGGTGGAGTIILSWLPVQSLSFTTTLSTPFIYKTTESITLSTQGQAGKVTFKIGKVRIPGCISLTSSAANSFQVTCNWKPNLHGYSTVTATLIPTGSTYSTTSVVYGPYYIAKRTNTR